VTENSRRPPLRSIRTVLLLNLMPTAIFAAVITVSSAIVVWWIGSRADALADAHARGALTPADLHAAGDGVTAVWLGALGLFLLATGAGLWVSRRAHRVLVARLDRAADYADSITRGAPHDPPSVRSDDALGALEGSLTALGRAVCERERALREQSAQRTFEGKLATAFKMAQDEPRTLDVVRRGLAATAPDLVAELLLADSSHAHLRRACASPAARAAGTLCGVDTPSACPASAGGHRATFADSRDLDACHYLQTDDDASACSAACFPVAVAGRTVGVLHTRFGADALPAEAVISRLERVAQETGTRLGVLRALSSSELAATTDPLTGLLNRRSLDDRFARLPTGPVAILMADLDHFKRLNDTFGHAAGDRALCAFAQCLTSAVRSEDLVARHGGEEFVLALPGAPTEAILRVVRRIRESLRARIASGELPPFTASFGVVEGATGATLRSLLSAADGALYEAKQAGRNRTVVAGQGVVEQGEAGDAPASARLVG